MEVIPNFVYEHFTIDQKVAWLKDRSGEPAIGFGNGLAQLAADFQATDENIGRNLIQRKLADGWRGQAASAATATLNRAAAVITGNGQLGNLGGDSSRQYGDSFNNLRNSVPTTIEAEGENSWLGRRADELGRTLDQSFGSTFGVQSDWSRRVAERQAADQKANEAFKKHEQTTRDALNAYQNTISGLPQTPKNDRGQGDPGIGQPDSPVPPGDGGQRQPVPPGGEPGRGAPTAPGANPGGAAHPQGADTNNPAPSIPTQPGAPSAVPPSAPTTSPAENAPPTPSPMPGGPGLTPSPSSGPPANTTPVVPPLAGLNTGGHSYAGAGPPPARPGGPLMDTTARGPAGGPVPGGVPNERPAGLGALPMGGAAGLGGQDREHRNNVFIPDDEPFRVEFDDVIDSVIGLPDGR